MYMKKGTLNSYGYAIHYASWGTKGPKILLLHSMGMDAHSMDQLAESLEDTRQVLSFTILDHGDSDTPPWPIPLEEHAEVIRRCARQLGFHPSVLIGHSVRTRRRATRSLYSSTFS